MKTLVTGAGGFIGSAVVRKLLGRGRAVRCALAPGESRKNLEGLDVEIVEADVNDRARVDAALAGCDTLYHLAAIYALWLPDMSRIYEVNVEGTKTILWAAYKAGLKKVVYTSSIAAVGRRDDEEPADETVQFSSSDWRDADAYVRSKWLSERDALRFAAEGLPLVVVNPAFPFGARDSAPTPTGGYILGTLKRQVPGYTDAGFCAVDVDDVAEGHVLAGEKGRVGQRYILGNHNIAYRDFFTLVAQVAGVPGPRFKLPRTVGTSVAWAMERAAGLRHQKPLLTYKAAKYAARRLYFDNSKARRELGLPVTPLPETVERAVRWFRDHGYA